ncbi:hypothetical protein NtB2_00921 [Lactococcus termiticola]|uniref:Uncharacterized protein n=1 Tax=Lactococcus termiticola TaxID=2169526 RepID=A0A2R5HFG9_9LACT|nr:hypothetical protein NtB2_00921 [Lactococcus termiticola]
MTIVFALAISIVLSALGRLAVQLTSAYSIKKNADRNQR